MAKDKKQTVGRRIARPGRTTAASEKVQIGLRRNLLSRTTLIVVLVAIGFLTVAGGLAGFYYKVYANPRRVFSDMLNNNLATQGITKEIIKPQANGRNDETTQTIFTPSIMVRDIRRVNLPATKTNVTIETIGTTSIDYQHYLKIDRPGKNGKEINYSRIYPLWVKNDGMTGGQAQLVDSAFFGATLFGNLTPANRNLVTKDLKSAYQINFDAVQRRSEHSRELYVYDATMSMRQYAKAAQTYAASIGLPIAAQINPNIYSKSSKIHVVLTVDVLSRQLRRVDYITQGVSETYSGYGTAAQISLPTKTVTPTELTQAINSISQ